MSSIICGYEYDIFISYRQKDNKYDGWVTEFVDNLEKELEATFKDEVTIYFDINPHDGLLETHNVDASLKEKLKCLVFIPVISRTYCDPKSYAWQKEFLVFNEMVRKDQLGKDIRLSNGNVASRILPVRIHELDSEDRTLLENELGGIVRAINFIYRSDGVNRSLRPFDEPTENLYRSNYRNQINKVANSIKELISALENPISKEKSKPMTRDVKELGHPENSLLSPLCLAYLFDREYDLAEKYARKEYESSQGKGHGAANLIICLAATGKKKAALKLYKEVCNRLSFSEFPELLHVKANSFLGNIDVAFEYLDKAISERNYWLFTLKYSPEWDLLRSDPRFKNALIRMRFPE